MTWVGWLGVVVAAGCLLYLGGWLISKGASDAFFVRKRRYHHELLSDLKKEEHHEEQYED